MNITEYEQIREGRAQKFLGPRGVKYLNTGLVVVEAAVVTAAAGVVVVAAAAAIADNNQELLDPGDGYPRIQNFRYQTPCDNVTSQKTRIFICATVRTRNVTLEVLQWS